MLERWILFDISIFKRDMSIFNFRYSTNPKLV